MRYDFAITLRHVCAAILLLAHRRYTGPMRVVPPTALLPFAACGC